MSLNLYCGDPRTGKSYQVVTEVIKNAIASGRRVVTNIRGVNRDVIAEYLNRTQGIPLEKIGEVVLVDNKQVADVFFFPTEDKPDTTVRAGDIVCIDECWKFWQKDKKLPSYVMSFFREHGHLIDPETKFNCDIVLITQLPTDLHKDILGIVEQTYRTAKLKEIGSDTRFTIEIFSKVPKYRDKPLRVLNEKYDPEKFAWYKSHTLEGATEQLIDKRANVLSGKLFKVVIPLMLILAVPAIYKLYSFFNPDPESLKAQAVDTTDPLQSSTDTQKVNQVVKPSYSDDWRVTGYLQTPNSLIFYITSEGKQRIVFNPIEYLVRGRFLSVKVDGQWITNFSGQSSEQSSASALPLK